MSIDNSGYYAKLFYKNLKSISIDSIDLETQWVYIGGNTGRLHIPFMNK